MTENRDRELNSYRDVARVLLESGYMAALVGGYERDLFLGRMPHDHDLATNAAPDVLRELFAGNAVEVNARFHDVVVVRTAEEEVEVATFRREGPYSDARRPDWVELLTADVMDAEEALLVDAGRRDFTVNAMSRLLALNEDGEVTFGELVDPFDGATDVRNGTLRVVNGRTSEEVLVEHPTRVMRALRFASVYAFDVDDELDAALHGCGRELLELVPFESVREEVARALGTAESTEVFLGLVVDYGFDGWLFPGVELTRVRQLAVSRVRGDWLARFGMLVAAGDVRWMCNRMRLMRSERRVVMAALRSLRWGWVTYERVMAGELPRWESELAVTGGELIEAWDMVPGPAVGVVMTQMLYAVWAGDVANTRETILESREG